MNGQIVGNYKLIEKLGEGGMGAVFKGVDMMLEREVAIKVLRPELARQPDIVERFRTEAVTLARLNHPNIATLYSFFRQGDDFFMVMEYVRGETLDNAIRRQGAMSPDRAVPLFCQALEGIGYAHKMGIIHRDIKPANMMLTADGSIKVMDFGIARVLGTARMTKQGNIIGTIEYMSPEQVRGLETDARSDIYSLGILLYEMLTGRVPFASSSEFDLMKSQIEDPPQPPRDFAPHIAPAIEGAIMRSLAKMADARFQTAGDFRAALIGNGTAESAKQVTTPAIVRPTRIGSPDESQATMILGPAPQLKETRLPAPAAQPQFGFPPPARVHASLFSRLNWKHYTAIGIGLLVLMTAPLVALVVIKSDSKSNSQSRPPSATGVTAPSPPPVQTVPVNPGIETVPGQIPGQSLPAPGVVNPLEGGGIAVSPTQEPQAGSSKSKGKAVDSAARERAKRRAAAERALDK